MLRRRRADPQPTQPAGVLIASTGAPIPEQTVGHAVALAGTDAVAVEGFGADPAHVRALAREQLSRRLLNDVAERPAVLLGQRLQEGLQGAGTRREGGRNRCRRGNRSAHPLAPPSSATPSGANLFPPRRRALDKYFR